MTDTYRQYSAFDKTTYLQRLLFAIENACKGIWENDEQARIKSLLIKQAETEIDNAIGSLTDILEIIGYFPVISDNLRNAEKIWKQPYKKETKQ